MFSLYILWTLYLPVSACFGMAVGSVHLPDPSAGTEAHIGVGVTLHLAVVVAVSLRDSQQRGVRIYNAKQEEGKGNIHLSLSAAQ